MPDTPGSLGIAISEAIEAAVTDPTGQTRYCLGSVLNHVLLHQTIIGLEAKKQLAKFGEKKADVVIGCAGGGSNFAGIAFPFVADKIARRQDRHHPRRAGESARRMTRGPFVYDHGDTARMTPLLPMHSLGHAFVPAAHPRRRPAVPRHGPAGQPRHPARACVDAAGRTSSSSATRRPSCGPAPRASSPPRRPATPSPPSSTRPRRPRKRARRRSSSSAGPATA